MSKERTLHYDRRFLNPEGHHTIALVESKLDVMTWANKKKVKRAYLDGYVTIGDCNRTVTLSCCTSQDLEKLDALMTSLVNLRSALAVALKEYKGLLDEA